jgi:hypothetical protein
MRLLTQVRHVSSREHPVRVSVLEGVGNQPLTASLLRITVAMTMSNGDVPARHWKQATDPFLTPYFTVWENAALCAEAEIAYQLLASCGMADHQPLTASLLRITVAMTMSNGDVPARHWKQATDHVGERRSVRRSRDRVSVAGLLRHG